MNPFPQLRHWLKGIGKLRGFGIQSPWAYDFVRDVVAERRPYYKYAEIDKLSADNNKTPQEIEYALQKQVGTFVVDNPQEARLLLLSVMSPHAKTALPHLPADSTLILFGINQSAATRQRWAEISTDSHSTTTFNLWKTGIIFIQNRYQQQHYILNF